MNTATKVGEIFTKAQAGDSYNKIGDMIIMLAPAAHELIAIDEKNAIYYDQQQQQTVQLVSGNAVSAQQQSGSQQVITLTPEQYAQLAQQQQAGANVKYELATAQVAQGQQPSNVKYVLANQSGTGQATNVVNVVTSSPNQQMINGISLPQQPLPLVQQHQHQFVQQQVQTAPSTSKTTIIKAEVPNTPLAIQQIQTPDVSALLEAAVCQQEAQHQAAAQGTLVTTEAPAVANEEEISNIVHTS